MVSRRAAGNTSRPQNKPSQTSSVQRGGKWGAGPGHPESKITKIEMLSLDDFSYCRLTDAL